MKTKAIFLTNKSSLTSSVTGGVQLCSQEFYEILNSIKEIEIKPYYVSFTKNIFQRVQIKIGFENYSMYNVQNDQQALLNHLKENKIEIVFINMASLIRYAKPIKESFGKQVKIVLLSHGNHSGDFLHLITKPIVKISTLRNFIRKIRLGLLLATESTFRVNYLDAVIALSETEKQIENWFGAKQTLFVPRRLKTDFLSFYPVPGRVGFVGRLDHPPNLQGIEILLTELLKQSKNDIELRLVGAPDSYGKRIAALHSSVNYLGELSDEDLEKEVSTWALLLNPVWWYSTGASTKLAKAISWGVPIVTTTAGCRGYQWMEGSLLMADTPEAMCKTMLVETNYLERITQNAKQTRLVAQSGYTLKQLGEMIHDLLKKL
jgi:glycosyltransferase involved in cell wall biosynthesis